MNDKNLLEYIQMLGLTNEEFATYIDVSYDTLKTWLYRNKEIPKKKVDYVLNKIKIHPNYTHNNEEDYHLKKTPFEELQDKWEKADNYLIPLYDDVSTFGGNVETNTNPVSQPTEYINAGSWFGKTKLTAGIRHYGDSMVEYPNGCILAIKQIYNLNEITPGQNYVIETEERMVTKRIQFSNDNTVFMAYSSNMETYPDGTFRHQPFPIEKKSIRKISLVVGRIVKEHSSGEVITI